MGGVIPSKYLIGLIETHYPNAGNGTQPMPPERMLRVQFVQHWFNLADPAMGDALYDSESTRRFAGIEIAEDAVPDESTILRFRQLLKRHKLSEGILSQIRKLLDEKRLLLISGTIMDATIIVAPPSTKNAAGARDPGMHQAREGKARHFGMKAHVGIEWRGIVHSLTSRARNSDFQPLDRLKFGPRHHLCRASVAASRRKAVPAV